MHCQAVTRAGMKPTTLITGAGKRIGALLAHHLAACGHNLVLHYHHSGDEAAALATALRALPAAPTVTLVQADLAQPETLATFWRTLPPVTQLIHNASHYARDTLADFSPRQLREHLAVNLEAPLLLTQGFLAQLPPHEPGNIVVLGDGYHGWSISPEFFTYAASKHAWASLIDLLAAACAPRVRANLIALGPTLKGAMEDDALFARLIARAPLQHTGSVPELCATLDFLWASLSITGQTFSLAGGMGLHTARP